MMYLSFILQYILSSQSHVLPYFLLIITGCSNSNLYLFQWCLLALDMYLQNPFVEFYSWLLPTSCSFPSNVLFFFSCPTYRSQNVIFKRWDITLWLQLFIGLFPFRKRKKKKFLKWLFQSSKPFDLPSSLTSSPIEF